jgi:hypothetical protein
MNTKQKIAVALGLAGAATAYAMNGEFRAVQPLPGKTFAEAKVSYDLPFRASGFTLLDVADSCYSGFTDVSRPIVGPLGARARLSHNNKPISGLEAGLSATIPTGKLPAFAESYALHSVNSNNGTIGVFGTIGKDIKIGKLQGKVSVDAVAEMSYEGLKPTFLFGNIEPSIEIGNVKAGYKLTPTSAGTSQGIFAGLKI